MSRETVDDEPGSETVWADIELDFQHLLFQAGVTGFASRRDRRVILASALAKEEKANLTLWLTLAIEQLLDANVGPR